MAIELELTAPSAVPTTVVNPAPTPVSASLSIQRMPSIPYIADPSSPLMHLHSELSLQDTLLLMQEPPSQWSAPCNKGKGKVKDDDDEEEATQKFRKELEDFVVPTAFDDKLLASLLLPPSEYYEGNIGLP
ncbi:hypothetical protein C0995_008684 [Termitomyces sp. Mi166|nr:hypothetical protein C0995_008684 [Termitomyces sp. Mi166\